MTSSEHNEVMYKTAMCRTFASSGSCPYGYKCLFAHGPDELRSVSDNEVLQHTGASPRQVPNYRSAYRSTSAIHALPASRGLSALSSRGLGQRHHSVINQSLVAQSARRSRAFFPADASSPQMLAPLSTAGTPSTTPTQHRHSLVYPASRPTASLASYGSASASPAAASSVSPSPRASLLPATPNLTVAAASPRKWSTSSPSPSPSEASASRQRVSPTARTPQAIERAKKLYKTELCRSWQEYQMCPYGLKCQFAHGEAELRQVERHRKYKTERCRKFHAEGVCPFGSRCIFIHDEDDRELPNSPKFDPLFAAQMRQRRASGPVRHLNPSVNTMDPMSPLGISPMNRSMGALPSNLSPASSMRSQSPYSKRFSRFGDENTSVDDFIKRRMTDQSMDERIATLNSNLASMALKDGSAAPTKAAAAAKAPKAAASPDNKEAPSEASAPASAMVTAATA